MVNYRLLNYRTLKYRPNNLIFKKYISVINDIPLSIKRPRKSTSEPRLQIKSASEIEKIRLSCHLASKTLRYTKTLVLPGISTQELNDLSHKFILNHGGYPSPLGYDKFPGSICTSVNNVICHGIPSDRDLLNAGDLCKIDVTVYRDGYHGDTCATFPVQPDKTDQRLLDMVRNTRNITNQIAESVGPGMHLSDIGSFITDKALTQGYQIAAQVMGHGIGADFHEVPFVSHFQPVDNQDEIVGDDLVLKPGMVFTIEPAFLLPNPDDDDLLADIELWPDQWTVASSKGYPSTQFEHTVLITENGSEVLTKLHE